MFIQGQQNSNLFLPASFARRGVGVRLCRQRGSEDKHLLPPARGEEKSCSPEGEGAKLSSVGFTAVRGCIRCRLCPQSALWFICTEISFVSLKATLRQHKTSAENSPRSPTHFFFLLSRANGTLFTPCPL